MLLCNGMNIVLQATPLESMARHQKKIAKPNAKKTHLEYVVVDGEIQFSIYLELERNNQ